LHTFLLEKRQYHKWLPREKLGKMAIDATSALQFVHSKGVVHRNVTIYSFSINFCDIPLDRIKAMDGIDIRLILQNSDGFYRIEVIS
jgi:hypothetical protein